MEGTLMVPPDRATIIGRAIWKTRYVVIGPLAQKDGNGNGNGNGNQSNLSFPQVLSPARIKDLGGWGSKPQQRPPTDDIFLSVYKNKDEWEAVHQHSIASITDCQVSQFALRKQGHVLPTLAITVRPDPATDKVRKRRSSRTAGLTTTKDSGPNTLLFRLAEDSQYTLGDWARYIQSLIQPDSPTRYPLSPTSPISPSFMNPFPTAPQETAEYGSSESSSRGKKRSRFQPKSSGHSHRPTREAAATYNSDSTSLHSRQSDLSSHASSANPSTLGFVHQHYTTVHPSDLPSPATTVEYTDQFIEGWTTAQGRSSVLSSPVRGGRGSVSSSQYQGQPNGDPSSPPAPPAPRETILDRAFQLRYIPGAEQETPGEEQLSSLARFEALMRGAEQKQKTTPPEPIQTSEPLKSTWEEDDSDESDEFGKEEEDAEEESDDDAFEQDVDHDSIGPSASRALQFIANRHSASVGTSRWPHATRTSTYSDYGAYGGSSILRPHTAHSRLRPAAGRSSSQPHITPPTLDIPSSPIEGIPEEVAKRRSHEKRHSTSGNLSFNEFTKRLSSTSSLLLVQTNVSAGSSRGSSDFDSAQQSTPRGNLSPRTTSMTPSERDERCRWRGSVGVFGKDGGFL
ncbi:hypothetical protein F4780DRAFT_256056 [Xylariomycetidae sp. FL0641]|nr:hypothetical protein F4780DRAFT_256056 [Xylariomycetidae sp. FL0641]